MESEMRSLIDEWENKTGRLPIDNIEKDILAHLATRSIQNKDIWYVSVSPNEFVEALSQYKRNKIFQGLMHLSDCGLVKRESSGNYIPALGTRLVCEQYLKRHPEIKDVKTT
jgi:phosphatidate phosphatase APP1